MNAPVTPVVRRALAGAVGLDDKYALERGRAFMSGVQALVRLPMLQRVRDAAAGLDTAGFVSGYRGSPLGGYDQALWQAREHLAAHHVSFQPGVNEELAATAVWGSQQLDLLPPERRKFDGVFGLWYGKGPGVDRCSDVFKHANMAGTARHGGVIAVAGDDHVAKSSTAAHQSDHIFKACGLPVFFPSSVQEILDLGLHAWALSRYAGVWSAMKTIQDIVESSSSVSVDADRLQIVLPDDFALPEGGLHIRWPDAALEQEARLMDHKWYAALAYIRANRLNRDVLRGPGDRFGLIASGKAWNDMRQALHDLGLDDDACRALGIRLHKVGVVWPLEAGATRAFAEGLREILVVEEKRQVIEYQLKEELYDWRADVRPKVLGKFDEADGDEGGGEWSRPDPAANWLLRAKADLDPAIIARAIARRLKKLGVPADVERRMDERLALLDARQRCLASAATAAAAGIERPPWFCPGCPHNTSTRLPEGSRALAGIGCHYMALWMDRSTATFTQMGGEGASWVGQAPFTTEPHVFANLGDGTYFHSGVLAVRQAIAAGVNITYKILYNDAVAMTGGQPIDGTLQVPEMARELDAEGARRIVVVTDEPERYEEHGVAARLPPKVTVHHRDELDAVQRELRETAGCTVLIYDQTCATEKRRRRKRGTLDDPARRVFINELVCEGCGDCSVQSNCLSVEPVETEFGRKRRINQDTCNKDYSCLKGFCPSFVTVEGGSLKSARKDGAVGAADAPPDPSSLAPLPEPVLPACAEAYGIVVAGVGGTGVITVGQLLGMAAHLDGKAVVTQDAAGLAQKGGSTWSHVQIAEQAGALRTTKVSTAAADLVLGCDPIVAASPATLATVREGRTFVALDTHGAPTAAFVKNADWQFPGARCEEAIAAAAGAAQVGRVDAGRLASALLGDSIHANLLLLGYAWQRGRVPLTHAAIVGAIELNATQAGRNRAAFEWGRRAAHDAAAVEALAGSLSKAAQVIRFAGQPALDETVATRAAFLADYQDRAYAETYRAFVERVRLAESALAAAPPAGRSARLPLADAVARGLFKLMAYKDEYEVARLHADSGFVDRVAARFEGDFSIAWHLAPPLLARSNERGEAVKRRYGPWMLTAMRLLARARRLRGTAFDPFGYAAERREERALVAEYRACIEELLKNLSAGNLAAALVIARIPDDIRGYGHVKARHLAAARPKWAALLADWRSGGDGARHRDAA